MEGMKERKDSSVRVSYLFLLVHWHCPLSLVRLALHLLRIERFFISTVRTSIRSNSAFVTSSAASPRLQTIRTTPSSTSCDGVPSIDKLNSRATTTS